MRKRSCRRRNGSIDIEIYISIDIEIYHIEMIWIDWKNVNRMPGATSGIISNEGRLPDKA